MSYALAVVMLLCAAGLRLVNLTTLPLGLSDVERTHVEIMEDHLKRGDVSVFYALDDGSGQEGLYHTALAISTLLFGIGTFGLRVLSAFVGMVTLALMYSLGKRLFGRVAGISAAFALALMFWAALLSRLVLAEVLVPLFVTAILLSLARTMPVYRRNRAETTNTVDFAALGILLGLFLYVHPSSALVMGMALVFIGYIIATHQPLSPRRLSYIGFAVLMALIIALPYMLSTLRLPDLSAFGRLFSGADNILQAPVEAFLALMIRGDRSALVNVPGRPLVDVVTGVFMLLGVIVCGRYWRQPRYMLLLLAIGFLTPMAIFGGDAVNFLAFTPLVPIVALLVGLGISVFVSSLPQNTQIYGVVGVLALLGFNIFWTINSLFLTWGELPSVQEAYHTDLGLIAHHLDNTADEVPTVLCYRAWERERQPTDNRSRTEWLLLMMNRDHADLRAVDCQNAFVFTDGGDYQQVVFAAPQLRQLVPPEINEWLEMGDDLDNLPDDAVIAMNVRDDLADALGVFTTTSPAAYDVPNDGRARNPVPPPVRFGGNITWLGYSLRELQLYEPGDDVPITTYWRVEGALPSDLTIFHHILSDPVTLLRARDTLSVNADDLQDRDVFIQVSRVLLPPTTLNGEYAVSVGVYQSSSDDRLAVMEDGTERGRRLFLYRIDVRTPAEETDN